MCTPLRAANVPWRAYMRGIDGELGRRPQPLIRVPVSRRRSASFAKVAPDVRSSDTRGIVGDDAAHGRSSRQVTVIVLLMRVPGERGQDRRRVDAPVLRRLVDGQIYPSAVYHNRLSYTTVYHKGNEEFGPQVRREKRADTWRNACDGEVHRTAFSHQLEVRPSER